MQRARVDLRAVARYAIDAIGPEIARHRHRLTIQLPETPVWASADGARLEQAFSNNAAKYTPDGGDIVVAMECEPGCVRIRIRDSGIGIEPAMLVRVFGLFVRAGTLLPGCEAGHGIGLAVVRSIVEQHGGAVTAMSAGLGRGSEFTVTLPALEPLPGSLILTP